MQIEVWADVVCPWCYIGKKHLEKAIAQSGLTDVKVIERSFQLDPSASTQPQRTVELLGKKYGMGESQVKEMMDRVTGVAAKVGLEYHLDRTLSGNTIMAHRLLKHADAQGLGAKAWEHLYRAYFTDGRSLFDAASLETLATEIGITGAKEALAGSEHLEEVEQDFTMARQIGVTGVPFFVIDRKLAVSGAQPIDVLAGALTQASTMT